MSGALEVFVDGDPCQETWPQDRALQYGDGLFETMRVRNGRVRFEALHGERLALGCDRLSIRADLAAIWQMAAQVARRHGDVLLKLQVTRGTATSRGYAPSGHERARIILGVFPAPQAAEVPAELKVVTLANRLGENPDLAGIKHCNRLEQVLARASLAGSGAFEGLMASSSGNLVSGTMSNVFMMLDGELVTPVIERCGVAGVLRAVVLREARRSGVPLRMADLRVDEVARCTSLAICNARLGLLAVDVLDGRRLQVSAPLRALAAHIDSLDD